MTSKTTRQGGVITEVVEYEYDLQGRLAKATTTPYYEGSPETPTVAQYGYNADGIRTSRTEGSQTTTYLVDSHNPTGYAQVLEETTAGITTSYIIGDDVFAQHTATDGFEYLLYDGHGSARQLVDDSQNLRDSYSYDAYGVQTSGGEGTSLRYCGEQYDSSLSQYYLRARYYDQSNSRFTTLDPYSGNTSDPQSLHKYTYCHADPINAIDPSGNLSYTEIMAVTAIIGFIALIAYGPLRNKREQIKQQIQEARGADAISFLSQGVRSQMEWEMMETRDDDVRGMSLAFYQEFGHQQQVVTYQNLQAEDNLLAGIQYTFEAASLVNIGLGTAGAAVSLTSGMSKIVWCKPHPPQNMEHWATIKWNAIWRATTKSDIKVIYTNRSISTVTNKVYRCTLQPDLVEVTTSDRFRIFEIRSPWQTHQELLEKGWEYKQALGGQLEYFDVLEIGQQVP